MKVYMDSHTKERKKGSGRRSLPNMGEGFANEVGGAIRNQRLRMGLTLEDVESRCHGVISRFVLSNIERGDNLPRLDSYLAICGVLQCGLYELLPLPVRQAISYGECDEMYIDIMG